MGPVPRELFVSAYSIRGVEGALGIHQFGIDATSGELSPVRVATPDAGYSYCLWRPDHAVMYATSAIDGGSVSGFAVDEAGEFRLIGRVPTGGAEPCHIAFDQAEGHLLISNFFGGSVSIHPLQADGRPGPRAELIVHGGANLEAGRSKMHSAYAIAGTNYVLTLDLGCDEVRAYRFDARAGRFEHIAAAAAAPGSGPRHLVELGERCKIVSDELSSTITVYDFDPRTGSLQRAYSVASTAVPLGSGSPRNAPSEIAINDDASLVYVANRGLDCITVFAIDDDRIHAVADVPCAGHWPRHFALVGEHLYVANQYSNSVSAMRIDPRTGIPEPGRVVAELPSPVCVLAR